MDDPRQRTDKKLQTPRHLTPSQQQELEEQFWARPMESFNVPLKEAAAVWGVTWETFRHAKFYKPLFDRHGVRWRQEIPGRSMVYVEKRSLVDALHDSRGSSSTASEE